jgi:hypothetical protein
MYSLLMIFMIFPFTAPWIDRRFSIAPQVTFTDSEGDATDVSLVDRRSRRLWQHFERQIQGLKDDF